MREGHNSTIESRNDCKPEDRAFALLKLGIALAQTGQRERAETMWTEAEIAADKIVLTDTKTRTLAGFCTLYAQAQEWSRAKIIADSIEHPQEKAHALLAISAALVRAQQWGQAEVILAEVEIWVHCLKNNQDKVILLYRILDVLEMAGKPENMLRLVQHALQRATTRIYAIQLLSLVTRLLPLRPELGIAYSEAFAWVDTFLNG